MDESSERTSPAVDGEATARAQWHLAVLWARWSAWVPRPAPGPSLQAVWALSGFVFAVAVTHVFGWSVVAMALAGLFGAGLTWLGRGLATVLVAAAATLGAIGLALRVTMAADATAGWSMRWLLPVSVVALVAAVLLARRAGLTDWAESRLAAAVLDLSAAAGSLALAALCLHRVGTATASSILLSSEDNAAWLNTVGGLRDAHGSTVDTSTAVGLFGPVANTYLAFVRELSGGLLPQHVGSARTASVVLSAHLLLIVVAPVVAALMARRTLAWRRPLLTLVTWAAVSMVVVTYAFLTPVHGFLTTGLAIVLVLTAACVLPGRVPDLYRRGSVLRWLAAALVLYAAGASWIPMAPLAGAGLVLWWVGVAAPAVGRGPWRQVAVVAVLALPTAVMAWALFRQYRDVVDPLGGGVGLFDSTGGTPAATTTMSVVAVGLVATGWLAYRGPAGDSSLPTFALPMAALVAYVAFALLDESYLTAEPPHYGTVKLLYVTVGLVLALGLADLLASPVLARLRLDAALFLVVAALFAGTVEQGPMFAAASDHWPKAQLPTIWRKQVDREAPKQARVLCLGLTPAPDTSQPSLDAYLCDRWASSLQGLDDDPAGDWRQVQLGRLPVSTAVARIQAAKDRPWTVVVIGSMAKLKDKSAWYAPIVAQPGLHFISSGF